MYEYCFGVQEFLLYLRWISYNEPRRGMWTLWMIFFSTHTTIAIAGYLCVHASTQNNVSKTNINNNFFNQTVDWSMNLNLITWLLNIWRHCETSLSQIFDQIWIANYILDSSRRKKMLTSNCLLSLDNCFITQFEFMLNWYENDNVVGSQFTNSRDMNHKCMVKKKG